VTRVRHAAAVALLAGALVTGAACEDDEAGTPRRQKEAPYPSLEQFDVEVFMDVDASEAEIGDVRARLRRSSGVSAFSFLSKEDAYEELKQLFADQPDLIEATRPADLPVSFRVVLATGLDATTFQAAFEQLPGVDAVGIPES